MDDQISKYDRIRGGLHDVAMFTKPSTIKNVQSITGKSETYIVETCRHEDQGDHIFIEVADENGLVRVCLPPKVASLIASQRDALTARRRSKASKRVAQERKDRGELPGFMRAKKGGRK